MFVVVHLVLAALVIAEHKAASQATCTVGMLGDNIPNHPLSQHIFYLHQSQFGTCYGRVHLLRFKVYSQQFYNQIPTAVYVSFWRPQTASSSYLSIGTAVVQHNSTELVDGLCEFNVTHNNITVQPGDRMGIWMEGAALKLNFLTIPSATSIVVPIDDRIRSAALSTAPEMVYFQGSANNDVVAMEVEIVPQSVNSTTDTTSPTETKDSSPTVLPSTLEAPTTSIASSVSPTSTTTVPGLEVPTTGVPEPDVSTASVPDLVVSSNHKGEESTTGRATLEDSSVLESPALSTVSQQGNITIGNNVGVVDSGMNGELALIVAIAGGVPVILVILLCVVVLAVMVRQWKVGGKPFRKIPAVVGDGSEGSFESSSSDSNGRRAPPRPQRQGHNYHVVDRNSNYKPSSEISNTISRPDSATTYVSRSSSVAANPLYEVTHCRRSQISSVYSGQDSNEYYSPPVKSNMYTYAHPAVTKKRMEKVEESSEVVNDDDDDDDDDSEDAYWSPPTSEVELYAVFQNKKFKMIQRTEVTLSETIGVGQFGNVCLGSWTHRGDTNNVAVKTLRKKAKLEDRMKFLREAAIMGQFMHPSIVKMHGVVLREDPVMIVLELLPKGDLKQYLVELKNKRQQLPQEVLQRKFLGFAQQISAGMNYLGNKKFIHRDLAARNILMADEDTCKIGDFGMARDLIHENYYVANGGKIPVKWTSLEALQYQKYSKASDVWSFGVLLYEIWSLGAVPYEGMFAMEIINFLKSGARLSPPPGCPRAIYELMIQSWHPEPSCRPQFSTFLLSLNNLYDEVVNWSSDQISAQYQIGRALVLGKSLYEDLQTLYLE